METTKEIREIQKNRSLSGDTLEDMTRKDLDNFEFLFSGLKTYYFSKAAHVEKDIAFRFNKAMKKLGINMKKALSRKNPEKAVDAELEKAGVRVEYREDKGIYFYVRDELAFFLSKPLINRFAIKDYQRYSLQTNISL